LVNVAIPAGNVREFDVLWIVVTPFFKTNYVLFLPNQWLESTEAKFTE